MENTAIDEILTFFWRVDADPRREMNRFAGFRRRDHADRFRFRVIETGDREALLTRDTQGPRIVSSHELQRQYAHADQVGTMDALITFCNYRLHAQQFGPLGRPVTRRTRAVFLAGNNQQRRPFVTVTHGGCVNG